ncbi:MAG TPA: hypothetical protein VI337_03160 [Nitrospirales bacterium]|nr:hypothetical protein [Nitrospirales bacterium]
MTRPVLRPIALVLAVAVLLLLGATTGEAFAHEVQHAAHHNAGMHGTGVCAWMCATAGATTTPALLAAPVTVSEEAVLLFIRGLRSFDSFSRLLARAPPVLS